MSAETSENQQKMTETTNTNKSPPPIEHITANIAPYSTILSKMASHAYFELVQLIKNLPSAEDPNRFYGNAFEADLLRKRDLLLLIVKIRNYLVKLYVLHKWSATSPSFGVLIDVLNWLRIYQSQFDFLVDDVKRIKIDMNFAKLPNHDLTTSFVVLNEAHYHNNQENLVKLDKNLSLLPSYNLLDRKPLPATFLLKLVKSLDSVLHLKLSKLVLLGTKSALNAVVYRNCSIKNGKIYMSMTGEFEAVLTVIAEDQLSVFGPRDLDNYKFILLDFKFLFGPDQDDAATLRHDFEIVPPLSNKNNLLSVCNTKLLSATNSLVDLYCYLHSYCLNYKLVLIDKQLELLVAPIGANRLTWGLNLRHSYNPENASVVVYYWTQKKLVKHKPYIQFSVVDSKNTFKKIEFCWFRDGKKVVDRDVSISVGDGIENLKNFNVQQVLRTVLDRHVTILMTDIHKRLLNMASAAQNSFANHVYKIKPQSYDPDFLVKNNENIIIKLHTKSVVYSIDSLTGLSFIVDPSPSVRAVCSKYQFPNFVAFDAGLTTTEFKSGPVFAMPTNTTDLDEPFVTAHQLYIIRIELLRHETLKVLSVTGWMNSPIITLDVSELHKLGGRDFTGALMSHRASWSLQYYQLAGWPGNWFLVVLIGNVDAGLGKLYWLAEIKSVSGKWVLGFVKKISSAKSGIKESSLGSADHSLDYDQSISLAETATYQLSIHIVMQQLSQNNVKTKIPSSKVRSIIENHIKGLEFAETKYGDKVVIILENSGTIHSKSVKKNIILMVELAESQMSFDLYGEMKVKFENYTAGNGIEINKTGWCFHIGATVDLKQSKERQDSYFKDLFSKLVEFTRTISLVSELYKAVSKESKYPSNYLDIYHDRVVLNYNNGQFLFRAGPTVTLEIEGDTPHKIAAFALENTKTSVYSLVQYIRITKPIVNGLYSFQEANKRLRDTVSVSALESNSHDIGLHIMCTGLMEYLVMYDFKNEVVKRQDQRSDAISMINRSMVEVQVSIVPHQSKTMVRIKFGIASIENQISNVTKDPSPKQKMNLSAFLRKLMTHTAMKFASKEEGSPEVIPLREAMLCDVEVFTKVLQTLYEGVVHKFK